MYWCDSHQVLLLTLKHCFLLLRETKAMTHMFHNVMNGTNFFEKLENVGKLVPLKQLCNANSGRCVFLDYCKLLFILKHFLLRFCLTIWVAVKERLGECNRFHGGGQRTDLILLCRYIFLSFMLLLSVLVITGNSHFICFKQFFC